MNITENGLVMCSGNFPGIIIKGISEMDFAFFVARGLPACNGYDVNRHFVNLSVDELKDRNGGQVCGAIHGKEMHHSDCSGFCYTNSETCSYCASLFYAVNQRKSRDAKVKLIHLILS